MKQIAGYGLIHIFVMFFCGCATLDRTVPHTVTEPSYTPDIRPARLAVVLSGGALRGFAHIGVLRELRANGIEPDLIVGTSAGAIVGALYASGMTDVEMDAAAEALDRDRMDILLDWTIPKFGLFKGETIHEFIDRHAKRQEMELFPIRFAAVAVEAERACLQVFNAGDIGKAVQASAAIPVVLAPVKISERRYLDGALASPLPVRVARALGATHVIAVDVTFDPAERRFGNILESYWRTTLVMRRALAANEWPDADHVLRPALPPESRISFAGRSMLIEAGAMAVRNDLAPIRKALSTQSTIPPGVHPALRTILCPEISFGQQSATR